MGVVNIAQKRVRMFPARVLLLGGTSEAVELASILSGRTDVAVISSLAGRVSNPRIPVGDVRIGGFGGVAGLTAYLKAEHIDIVVDATHPYATKISANAESACSDLSLPLIALERPPWEMHEGDDWKVVPDMQAAASLVNHHGNRIFLSVGRQELDAFRGCEKAWFLVRVIDPPSTELPCHAALITKRGPFTLEDELQLFREHSINLIVSKNSGGTATYAKIEAARALGIPVMMIDRSARNGVTVSRLSDVLQKLTTIFESGLMTSEV